MKKKSKFEISPVLAEELEKAQKQYTKVKGNLDFIKFAARP
jgi:hypothetical protein